MNKTVFNVETGIRECVLIVRLGRQVLHATCDVGKSVQTSRMNPHLALMDIRYTSKISENSLKTSYIRPHTVFVCRAVFKRALQQGLLPRVASHLLFDR